MNSGESQKIMYVLEISLINLKIPKFEGIKFLLIHAPFPSLNQLSLPFQTFEQPGKGLLNFDVIAEDCGKKLGLLNARLEDLMNTQIFNQKDTRKTNVQTIKSHLRLREEMCRVDAAMYVGCLIVLILGDVFQQGKNQKEIFSRRNTKKILELMVFVGFSKLFNFFLGRCSSENY